MTATTPLGAEQLRALLAAAQSSIFRLETRQQYRIPAEAERIRAFEEGRPLPPRSTASFRLVQEAVTAGKRVYRVHVVEHPLTSYLRYELAAYQESIAAKVGEEIYIADRAAHPGLAHLTDDFLLVDAETDRPALVFVRYDQDGRHLGWERSDDPVELRRCAHQRDLALRHAVDLNRYLAARHVTA
jgi:Family of unknown function (DUF6879)